MSVFGADKMAPERLIDLARNSPDSPQFREALLASVSAPDLARGTAVIEYGSDFLWAIQGDAQPMLFVDDAPWPAAMHKAAGDQPKVWFQTGKLKAGTSHNFRYMVGGISVGGR